MKTSLIGALALSFALTLAACGGDTPSAADAGVSPDAGAACGTGSTQERLLNAPTTAQVVKKTPTHPPIGPEGLP
jgi:ABC-type glycerol-3-phosphate transport system substrate-binding protein